MKTLLCSVLVWLGLTVALAQTPWRDFDPVVKAAWPGYPRGGAGSVAIAGDLAYVSSGSLQVFDLRDPASPRRLGHYGQWSPHGHLFAVGGNYAYLADYRPEADLQVVDVSDPAKPRLVGTYAHGKQPLGIAMCGQYAGLVLGWFDPESRTERRAFEVIDLGDPSHPERLGTLELPRDEWFTAIAASGHHVYLGSDGLRVIDISIPAEPRIIGRYMPNASGGVFSLVVEGVYAYLGGTSPTLDVVDISDPTQPRRVGQHSWSVNGGFTSVSDLAVSGSYIYLAHVTDVRIIDISDPTRPKRAGTYATAQAMGVAISGHHAYVSDEVDGLLVLDLTDPVNPRLAGEIATGGCSLGVALAGQHAYVAEGHAGMVVVDLSDAAKPREVASLDTDGYAQDVALSGHLALIADGFAGLELVDISTPGEPRRVGSAGSSGFYFDGVAATGPYACVAAREHGLVVIDISEPTRPQRLGRYATTGYGLDIEASGHYAYLAAGGAGLEVIDLADPAVPQRVGAYACCATQVAVAGDFAYIGTSGFGLVTVDISRPSDPRLVASLDLSHLSGLDVWGIAVSEDYVYMTGDGGDNSLVAIIDVSDPSQPHLFATPLLPPAGGARAVAMAPGFAVIANGAEGLHVLDLTNPSNPQRKGWHATPAAPLAIAVSGHHAFVTRGSSWKGGEFSGGGLQVMDVSDPVRPRLVGGLEGSPAWGSVRDVAVSGECAVLTTTEGSWMTNPRLLVLDVSDPSRPEPLGSYPISARAVAISDRWVCLAEEPRWDGEAYSGGGVLILDLANPAEPEPVAEYRTSEQTLDVVVQGRHAFLTTEGGVQILELTDPTQPRHVGTIETRGIARGVAVDGSRAYLAEGEAGLQVVDVSDPAHPRSVGRFSSGLRPAGVAVLGPYAYVTDAQSGLHVLDVSNPAAPRCVGGNPAPRGGIMAFYEDHLLVADESGLTVLNAFVPLRLHAAARQPAGLHLSLSGPPDWPVRVQRSADLTSWQDWQTLTTSGNAPVELADPEAASHPHRFYRVVTP